ncbi:MAG: GAF domain-containing sensor histidine kinase, partial [Candidatus Rokubacteria bacterium]|nr:GAF domain-containing sensor histidine kinase [Candidatus Rokubacteria bacterium]
MTMGRLPSGSVSLREAAVRIFALVALLPFLLLVFLLVLLLQRPDLVTPLQLQVSLLLAFVTTCVGFVAFYRMVAQIATIAGVTGAASPGDGAPSTAAVQAPTVPGLGQIAEIGQMGATLSRMIEDLRTSTGRLEDQVLKSSTLNELVDLAAKVPRIQDLLALVLEKTMRAVSATIGSIMLLDRERQILRVAAARGLPEDALAGAEVGVGEGISGTVAALGEPVLVEDIETDPRFARVNDPRYGSGSFICLPIRVEDRVIGVINLAKKQPVGAGPLQVRAFSATDLQFLNTLIGYIAYALDNARLLQEARDTADRLQQTVDELRATQGRLVEGETLRAIGQLASGMAHHLNNLLMVVSTRIQLLARRLDDPETRGVLDIAERAIRDAAEVVSRVRRFARAEQPVSDLAVVDLNQLCREVAELTEPRWRDQTQACGIGVEMSLHLGEVGLVTGEPGPLREVLVNLVLNAVDAMPHGGAIALRTWESARGVHLSVGDTGTGMSEEVRRRALEPFFTTKGLQGMGLGLSVIHGTVRRHRGELSIESAEGKG